MTWRPPSRSLSGSARARAGARGRSAPRAPALCGVVGGFREPSSLPAGAWWCTGAGRMAGRRNERAAAGVPHRRAATCRPSCAANRRSLAVKKLRAPAPAPAPAVSGFPQVVLAPPAPRAQAALFSNLGRAGHICCVTVDWGGRALCKFHLADALSFFRFQSGKVPKMRFPFTACIFSQAKEVR